MKGNEEEVGELKEKRYSFKSAGDMVSSSDKKIAVPYDSLQMQIHGLW